MSTSCSEAKNGPRMDDPERNERLSIGPVNFNEPHDAALEKESLLLKTEIRRSPRGPVGIRSKVVILTFIGCCITLIWLLNDCLPTKSWKEDENASADFELVKYQAPAPSATPSTGVLEVFQVYQPVLTPSGATDETTLSDGKENTTTIAPTGHTSSCEIVLMVHSFGYSYGMPFVGKSKNSFTDACQMTYSVQEIILRQNASSIELPGTLP